MPLPPLPPKRISSRISDLMVRPNNLNISQDSQDSIYARPKPFHRSSLMSTGSSDSGAFSGPSEAELAVSPLSPASELSAFTWPHYTVGLATSPAEHRSVSQVGDQDSGSEGHNTSMAARSDVYVRMNHVTPVFSQHVEGSPYMNLLYDAVQRQGGTGTVETAMSPYLEMTAANSLNVRNLRNATVDSVSAIYAQIESSAVSEASEVSRPPGPPRGRPAGSTG